MTQPQPDIIRPAEDAVNVPRWLPLVGIFIGLAFLGFITLAGNVVGLVPEPLSSEVRTLAFEGAAEDVTCALAKDAGVATYPSFAASSGSRPDLVSIRLSDPSKAAVLSIGNVPDLAILLTCRDGVELGERQRLGDTIRFSERRIATSVPAFALDDPQIGDTYLLYLYQPTAVSFQIKAFAPEDFEQMTDQQLLLHVALSSAAGFMIVYNLALSVMARMPTFLFNALTVCSMLLLNIYMSGLGAAYLWPESPHLSNKMLVLSMAGPALFAPFYVYRFIVPPDQPILRARPTLLGWPVAALLVIASIFFVPYYIALTMLMALWIALATVAVWHLFRASQAGNAGATIMLLAALGAVVPGMMIGAAKDFGGVEFGTMVPHLAELTILLEAVLFTLALAYQLRLSRWRELDALRGLNRQAEQAISDLLATIDSDRTRLASDLHDSTGQMLGLISSRLKRSAQKDDLPEKSRADIAETAGMIGDTLDEIRRMAHDLHPATLTHLGLEKAIEGLCRHMSMPGGVRFECDLEIDAGLLSSRQQLQIYRIVQELMTNTVRHAQASDARLSLRVRRDATNMRYSDNGQMAPKQSGRGIGWTILQQRVASLNGTLQRRSGELGTTIEMAFKPTPVSSSGAEP